MKKIFCLAVVMAVALGGGMVVAADGAALYKSCAGCHGADGSKSAGGSAMLKGQPADALYKKLLGYKDGSYGGKQKEMMAKIAHKHPDEELKALADYAGTLK